MTNRSLLVFIGAASLGACTSAPDAPVAPQRTVLTAADALVHLSSAVEEASRVDRAVEAEPRSIAGRVPGFAGFYYDADGGLVVRLVDARAATPAREAALAALARTGRPTRKRDGSAMTVRIESAKFDYAALAAWRDTLSLAFELPGVNTLDLDEIRNVVAVGVRDLEFAPAVHDLIARLGIPASAVVVEWQGDPVETNLGLDNRFRPLSGGTRIWSYVGSSTNVGGCSLGVPVVWNGQNVFLTGSHCTRWRNNLDGGPIAQNSINDPVGNEVWDRSGSTCGAFNRYNCRHADVAVIGTSSVDVLPGETAFEVGRIARPLYPTPGMNNGLGTTIVGNNGADHWRLRGTVDYALANDVVHKVGVRTGWTYGRVYKTCVDKDLKSDVDGQHYKYYCNDFAEVNGEQGDSGSPTFLAFGSDTGDPHGWIYFLGILWGADAGYGPSYSGGIISSVRQIRNEIGTFYVK